MNNRQQGYYWVIPEEFDTWMIGYWSEGKGMWALNGSSEWYEESEMMEIDETPIKRNEQ